MTISNISRTAGPFPGNGVTTRFPFTFKVFAHDDLLVALTNTATGVETVLTLDADYSVTLNSNQNSSPGGEIVMLVAPPVGTQLAATSNIALSQNLELTNNGGFYPKSINDALDRLAIQIQQLYAKFGSGLNVGAAAAVAAVLNFVTTAASGAGATLIGFLQNGVGAAKVTLASILNEWVTPQQFGGVGDGVADDTVAIERALATGKAVDLGDASKTWLVTRTILRTGKVLLRGNGATVKSDALPFLFTDASGSRVFGFKILPVTIPYTILRNTATWQNVVADVVRSLEGYMPTSQDIDLWPTLPANIKAQFDNFQPGGIKFNVSSSAGGKDVVVSEMSGYQMCITLEGYSDSIVRNCNIGGKREGIYFYNALTASNGSFTLPRGVNNKAINNIVKYASQCAIVFFGNDHFAALGNTTSYCGESGIKTYQHDPVTSTAVMCADGVIKGNLVYNNYYDGIDATNVNGIDSPGTYESRHVVVGNRCKNNRHTGITICGQGYLVASNDVSDNGSHGINAQGIQSTVASNNLRNNSAHPEIHAFQIFDLAVQGNSLNSIGNKIYNPNAPSTYNYVHTGLFGADPDASNEGLDIGNQCSHGATRIFMSSNIPSADNMLVGSGSRTLTMGAIAVFRQGGGGVDIGGASNIGYVRIRGDATSSANLDFTPNNLDPASSAAFGGRLLYDFTNNLFRLGVFGANQSVYMQYNAGFFPSPDNGVSLGVSSLRWTQLYAATSTIATSDERSKDEIGPIDAAVLRAWAKVQWSQYKFKDAIEKKADGARWHFGLIAQRVKAAFESEGLDAFAYGLLCYDEWKDKFIEHPTEYQMPGEVNGEGKPVPHLDAQGQPIVVKAAWRELITQAGNRYGIRYEEALALECALLRSHLAI